MLLDQIKTWNAGVHLWSGNPWVDNNDSEWQAERPKGLLFFLLALPSWAACPQLFVQALTL